MNKIDPTSKQLKISAGVMTAETVMQTAKAIAFFLNFALKKKAIVTMAQRQMIRNSSVVPIILFLPRSNLLRDTYTPPTNVARIQIRQQSRRSMPNRTIPLTEPDELTLRKSRRLIEGFASNGLFCLRNATASFLMHSFVRKVSNCKVLSF